MTPPTLIVRKVYPRYHEFGASISTTFGDWEVHAEGAYHVTEVHDMDDNYWKYVTGFNYTCSDNLTQLLEKIKITVEYAGISVARSRPSTVSIPMWVSAEASPIRSCQCWILSFLRICTLRWQEPLISMMEIFPFNLCSPTSHGTVLHVRQASNCLRELKIASLVAGMKMIGSFSYSPVLLKEKPTNTHT